MKMDPNGNGWQLDGSVCTYAHYSHEYSSSVNKYLQKYFVNVNLKTYFIITVENRSCSYM